MTDEEREINEMLGIEVETETETEKPEVAVEDPEPVVETAVEESVVGEPEGEVEELDSDAVTEIDDLTALRLQVEALQRQLAEASVPVQPQPVEPDFVSEEEYEEALTNREAMNRILRRVAESARVVSPPPEDVELVKTFYVQNPEFERLRPAVSKIGMDINREHPEWGVKEILVETEKRVRAAYGLPAKPVKRVVVEKAPRVVKPSAKRPAKIVKPTGVESDIEAMLSALGHLG